MQEGREVRFLLGAYEDEKMKVGIYARVSIDEQDRESRQFQDPENQLEPLRNWAKSREWEITGEYIDRCSGGDHNRPKFKQMLNDAFLRKFSIILVWKLDRFSREGISHTLSYLQQLRSRGIAVRSLTESWVDTSVDNPIGEFLIAVFSWVASEERRKISERTKLGIQRRKNLGIWRGGRPAIKATPEQEIQIKELLAQGKSIQSIIRKTKVGRKAITQLKGSLEPTATTMSE
ncbi:MAG: recombinase family protein [Candidatus Bathyarchaeota archaeon]|nr:recombinase family protein [Candidatus Bathyarchaeota archaeon]